MTSGCDKQSASGTSETVQVEHATRQDVLVFHLERAVAETSMSYEDFAEAFAQAYVDLVPADARSVAMAPPDRKVLDEEQNVPLAASRRVTRELGKLVTRAKRYRDGEIRIPADLEEAWVAALPEPYRKRCRDALVKRHGCIPAEMPAKTREMADADALGRICYSTAQTIRDMGVALSDGRFDQKDASLITDLDDLIATAVSARHCVLRGIEEPVDADRAIPMRPRQA